jgi:uncharacterized protein (DUF736 family)
MSEWKKLGAFWTKVSGKGKKFLAGEIEIDGKKTKITCWPNDKGGNEKRPDFVIYLSEDRDAPRAASKPAASDANESGDDDYRDQIPF